MSFNILSGQLKDDLINQLFRIDFSKGSFWKSAFFMVFNPIFWNLMARQEYKHRTLTKLAFGNTKLACYLFASCVFTLGIYRDYLFTLAVKDQKPSLLFSDWLSTYLGGGLSLSGSVFVLSSMYQLGIIGTYLGDYFGFLMSKRVTTFPYNVSDHPMYEGSTMIFLGYSLWNNSLTGILLTTILAITYSIASVFEGKFTSMIYSKVKKPKFR